MEYRLCPSILSADFNRLGEQIQTLEKAGKTIGQCIKTCRRSRKSKSDDHR